MRARAGAAVMDGPIRRRGGAGALIEQCAPRARRTHARRTHPRARDEVPPIPPPITRKSASRTFSEIIHNTLAPSGAMPHTGYTLPAVLPVGPVENR